MEGFLQETKKYLDRIPIKDGDIICGCRHAYIKLFQELENFWTVSKLIDDPDKNTADLEDVGLDSLVRLAAMAQYCAEDLGLIGYAPTKEEIREIDKKVFLALSKIRHMFCFERVPIAPIQIGGKNRFKIEFDSDMLADIVDSINQYDQLYRSVILEQDHSGSASR